ncbi:MAG: L-threonylcarbamoyladenylate synthase [Candidatus Saccharimonadales bacterium]
MQEYTNYADILKNGGVGVAPTDTIYGILTSALNEEAVNRVYEVKGRNTSKPLIILISDINDIASFGISLREDLGKEVVDKLEGYWPGPTSIILPCDSDNFKYLTRGTNSLAFRWPKKTDLEDVIKQTGPLVAPSANPEGLEPAKNIKEAREYFGDKVDFYIDGGKLVGNSSKLLKLEDNGSLTTLRS